MAQACDDKKIKDCFDHDVLNDDKIYLSWLRKNADNSFVMFRKLKVKYQEKLHNPRK